VSDGPAQYFSLFPPDKPTLLSALFGESTGSVAVAADLQRARELFLHAVGKLPPERWSGYVAETCDGDTELQRQVGHMLQVHLEAGSFLNEPVSPLVGVGEYVVERHGSVFGRYKLIEQIGDGGMGTVWMAEQSEPVRRTVALKLIKPGMDSRAVLARFEAERQALALMDHPNIARVLDAGGAPDGRPFFVMELVKGVPITRFCDEYRLTPKERLELFVPVCQAIQHAHQKGVIHRDIKPSNVLVALYDDRPVPKVIDFGVAKATGPRLTDKTLHTGFGAVIGTVEYMSPEQASFNQLDVDTRSDVYSLGVLLYELLTGSPPFTREELARSGLLETLRIIREQEPTRPSTKLCTADGLPTLSANRGTEPGKLTKLVRGELDWIVMKALEKDRDRRYETANSFAMDVLRYLADEAVLACPPSVAYRLRKFARRNKGGLATLLVVTLALLVSVGGVAGGFGWVTRDRAARQAATEQEVNLAIKEAEGLLRLRRYEEALSVARRAEGVLPTDGNNSLRAQARDVEDDARMALRLDEIRLPGPGALGATERRDLRYAQAFRHYGIDVEALSPRQAAEQVAARAIRTELIVALDNWANELKLTSKGADTSWKRLIAVARAADPDEWRNQVRDAMEQGNKDVLHKLAESPRVNTLPLQTLELLGSVLHHAGIEHDLTVLRAAQLRYPNDFWINFKLAWALEFRPRSEREEALRFYTAALAIRPHEVMVQMRIIAILLAKGQVDEAIGWCRKAVELDPTSAVVHTYFGNALVEHGKLDKAIASYEQAITLDPNSALLYRNLGNTLSRLNKLDEAVAAYKKAITLDPNNARAHTRLGDILGQQNKLDEAIACYHKAIELDPINAAIRNNLGNTLLKQGKPDEAIACYQKAIALDPMNTWSYARLGDTLRQQHRLDEAVAAYRKLGELQPNEAWAHRRLGDTLRQQNKPHEALAAYRHAVALNPKNGWDHHKLGLYLQALKKFDEAIACYHKAIELAPNAAAFHNELAWLLATCSDVKMRDPIEAVIRAGKAVQLAPQDANYWNTLGVAHYRAGDWRAAVTALDKSMELRNGGDGFDWLFMAMAHCQLGDKDAARKWYDKAIAWAEKYKPDDDELGRFRAEAAELLGVKEKTFPP
jgi:tetratricopeptide (TPR) repeat protein